MEVMEWVNLAGIEMEVTVVIPCYNQVQELRECLLSLIDQTYKEWEAIVVNDASTKDLRGCLVGEWDGRIRFVDHEVNIGLGGSRNTGIGMAGTEWVVCVDADDRLEVNFLEELFEPFFRGGEYDCIFGDIQCFGERNERWELGVYDERWMTLDQWIPGAGVVMRKEVWEKVGGYCEEEIFRGGNEDWDFWIGAMDEGIRIRHCSAGVYWYRIREDSMNRSVLSFRDYRIRERIYERRKDFFDRYGRGGVFIFNGYMNSSRAYRRVGDWKKGFDLYRKAYGYRSNLWGLMVIGVDLVISEKFRGVLRRVYDLIFLGIMKRVWELMGRRKSS